MTVRRIETAPSVVARAAAIMRHPAGKARPIRARRALLTVRVGTVAHAIDSHAPGDVLTLCGRTFTLSDGYGIGWAHVTCGACAADACHTC